MAKKKYYVVWEGHEPGVYEHWPDAQRQIQNFPGAKYKSFSSLEEAVLASRESPFQHIGSKAPSKPGTSKPKARVPSSAINYESISVDAACSGNPGVMEYQGVDTRTGTQLFHKKFQLGTNNIGEFLALVHGIAMLKKQGSNKPVYSDSKTAMGWVRKKHCKTTLPENKKTEELWGLIRRAEHWLKTNTFSNPLLKWETESWGEIPADFGRK